MEIGEKLREMRLARKMTQMELSGLSGIKQATISAIENGHNEPTTPTLKMLAAAMGCEISDLLGEYKKTPTPEGGQDEALIRQLMDLSPDEAQRVRDFVAGLKAGRKG